MKMPLVALLSLTMFFSSAGALSAGARRQGPRDNPLTPITGLRCVFTVKVSATWKNGKPDVQTAPTNLRVTITDINLQDGTAEASGPDGRRFAVAVLSDGSLYFMETTRGALDVTTVFATESSPGKLKAVRAQQGYVFLTVPPYDENPSVAQNYGECEAVQAP